MSDTGYPDFQDARDYLAGLVGQQDVANASRFTTVGTQVPIVIAAGSRIVLRHTLLTAFVQATAAAGGPVGHVQITVSASQGLDGSGAGTALIAGLSTYAQQGTAQTQVVSVPGPLVVQAVGVNNLVQVVTTSAIADFWFVECDLYYILI